MAVPADPTNVMGRRIGATLVDAALVVGTPMALVSSKLEYYDEEDGQRSAQGFCDVYLDEVEDSAICVAVADRAYYGDPGSAPFLTLWGGALLVFVLLQGLTGWTIGKLISGIRVVQEDGSRPGLGKAFVRWLLWIVDGLPFVIPGLVAFITGLTTVGHRRVGDMAARTYVVHAAATGSPIVPPAPTSGGNLPPPPSPDGPQWDEARGTYIQWDAERSEWMRWDDEAKRWEALPGQPPAG